MMRVLDAVFGTPNRKFSGGITMTAPTKLEQAMGQSGTTGVVSIAMGSEGGNRSITCYVWLSAGLAGAGANGWFKLGATPSDHTLTFVPQSLGGFKIPENTPFYLAADANITDAWTDAIKFAMNPNS